MSQAPIARLDAGLLTIKQLATELGLDRAVVESKLESIAPAMTRGSRALYRLVDVWPALACMAENGNVREELAIARAALSRSRQRHKHLALRERLREVMPVHEATVCYADAAKSFTGLLDTLPDVLERDCGLDAPQVDQCFDLITAARAALYQHLLSTDESTDGKAV